MTILTKPVRRTTNAVVSRETIIVTLYPAGIIGFRSKRSRREYTLPLVSAYRLAIEADLAARRAERAKARKARAR